MRKTSSNFLMVIGLVMMFSVLFVYGFVETNIPKLTFLLMWGICAGIIYMGVDSSVESDSRKMRKCQGY